MKKYILSFSFFLVLTSASLAQQFREIDKNLNLFYKLNPSAKLSLFFNQPGYAPGDTAYFLARLVNSVDLKPIRKESVLHLILVDTKGHNKLDEYFVVEDGIASNQIIIPPNLKPGIYRLLCFRDPVSSFKGLFYQHNFEIFGAQKNAVVDTTQSVSVFPEGGSILAGTQNKIFVVHPSGRSTFKVVDGSNHEVTSFKTNPDGTGFFFLKPDESLIYSLSGNVNNVPIKVSLPSTKKSGANLISMINHEKLKIEGSVIGATSTPELILIKNDRVYYAEKLTLDNTNSFSSEVPLGETLNGLFQVWIVDKKTVLASRMLYYTPGLENEGLKMKHPLQVHPRTAMEILLEKNDSLMRGTFSVRVYKKSLFSSGSRNIFSNLELFNDLPPGFELLAEAKSDSINDFLATQQWRRYNIDSLVKGKFKIGKVNFDQPYLIRGKCIGLPKLDPSQQAMATFYFENSNFIEEIRLDKEGNFAMELSDPISLHEKVYYRIDVGEIEAIDAKLDIEQLNKLLPVMKTQFSNEPNPYFSYKNLMNSADRSYNYFSDNSNKQRLDPERLKSLESKTFFDDKVYNLKDYKVFSSMKEVIVEILPKLKLKMINGKRTVRVVLEKWRNQPDYIIPKGDPLYIIDGVPTHDTEFFLSLTPSKIDKIKIIWKLERSALKSFGNNGVIIVETQENALVSQVSALNSFNLTGHSSSLPFGVSKKINDQRTPYFKSCLFWNPLLEFDKKGVCKFSFFTSDDLGEYEVDVEGLSREGAPYFSRSSFKIVPEKEEK